jgi:hypothetical protein
MKKLLLIALAFTALLSITAQNRTWDFTGDWVLTSSIVDDNLTWDSNRFNYGPATTLAELVFADAHAELNTVAGQAIPDVAGLKFTQGGTTKLRLGCDAKYLYLNGGSIVVEIPATIGDKVTIAAKHASGSGDPRWFTPTNGTLLVSESAGLDADAGVAAGASATWVYTVTDLPFQVATSGGLNITKITVASASSVSTPGNAKEIKSVQYFNVLGKEISPETKGLVFVKTIYTNGSSEVLKLHRN